MLTGKSTLTFVVSSLIVAGPFLVKSFVLTGTPLYPIGYGVIYPTDKSVPEEGLRKSAAFHMNTRDSYGHGRSVGAFLSTFLASRGAHRRGSEQRIRLSDGPAISDIFRPVSFFYGAGFLS